MNVVAVTTNNQTFLWFTTSSVSNTASKENIMSK